MAYLPCQNPQCSSKGKPHPNCQCYQYLTGKDRVDAERAGYELPGTTKGLRLRGVRGGDLGRARRAGRKVKYMAHGGEVDHFCGYNIPHLPSCEYFALGGPVTPVPTSLDIPEMPDPPSTMGHAAVSHGLLGLLKNVGRAKVSDPEKAARMIQEAREHTTPSDMPTQKTMGHKFGDHLQSGRHEEAADLIHGHATMGSTAKSHLPDILAHMAPAILAQEPHPDALKSSAEYLGSAIRGHSALEAHMGTLLGKPKASESLKPNREAREQLKKFIDEAHANPQTLLDVGGNIGHYLPNQAGTIGATAAKAVNYFQSIKPVQPKMNPLDKPMPVGRFEESAYNRQIDIAQDPRLLLEHVKTGTIVPQDVTTIKTIFPALYESMCEKASEKLIEAETEGKLVPYSQKVSLSILLGQPLDTTMTPMAAQAILKSAAPQQAENQSQGKAKGPGNGGVSSTELEAIDKADEMGETKLERRQADRR